MRPRYFWTLILQVEVAFFSPVQQTKGQLVVTSVERLPREWSLRIICERSEQPLERPHLKYEFPMRFVVFCVYMIRSGHTLATQGT